MRYVHETAAPKVHRPERQSARSNGCQRSLGISIDVQLPRWRKTGNQANDHGLPLATTAAKNPLRRGSPSSPSIHDLEG